MMPRDDSESVGVVRRTIAALNRLGLDEALDLMHPDVELRTPLLELWRTEREGHDRVREWFERIEREWAFLELYDVELEERRGQVLGRMRARGRGKASRNELDWELHVAAEVVDGRLARFATHLSRERALNAIQATLRGDADG